MKLMLVDGNSILNRAFYGVQGRELLSTSDGMYTNAVYGFINMLIKFMEEERPEYICVAFDLRAATLRHKEYEGYKASRKGMPEELAMQVPVMKEVLDAMNISRLELEGYEADDLIGAACKCGQKSGMEVVIVTGDRDAFQLIDFNVRVKLPRTRAGKTTVEEYDLQKFTGEYGIEPSNVVDLKALMGDSSDNIPGVKGIGEKTALQLIREYKDIDQLYLNIDTVKRESVRNKLASDKQMAYLSKKLATIKTVIPGVCEDVLEFKCKEYNRKDLLNLFKRLEFKTLISRLGLDVNTDSDIDISSSSININCDKCYVNESTQVVRDEENLKNVLSIFIGNSNDVGIYYFMDKTEQFKTRLLGIGMAVQQKTESSLRIDKLYIDIESMGEDKFLINAKPLLENPDIKKYGHDIKNLIVYLKNKGIELKGLKFDTSIAAYIVNPTKASYTVQELAYQYIGIDIELAEQTFNKSKHLLNYKKDILDRLSNIFAMHSAVLFDVSNKLLEVLNERDQTKLYFDIELPLIEVLADMESCGMKVDEEGLKYFSEKLDIRIMELSNEIYNVSGEQFNINSTKQLANILFEKLKLPAKKKNKTGYSTDIEVLEKLSVEHEIVSKIIEYRQLVKLKSTYVDGLLNIINPNTRKIHSSFNQTVTATGRISSTEPNLQNIPIKLELGREIRRLFIASGPEVLLMDADYSQIELRVLAHIANDINMIEAFNRKEDIHTKTAVSIFNVPEQQVSLLMRSKAKTINFGIVYGMGDFSLAKDLKISKSQAKEYIDHYFDEYSGVKTYMKQVVEAAKQTGYVSTLFNRKRYIPQLKSRNFAEKLGAERIAINTPIQGTAADIIKVAMINVYYTLKDKGFKSKLVLQVHDELIIEVFKDEIEEVRFILKDCMENLVQLKVPLSVEVKEGCCWYDTK